MPRPCRPEATPASLRDRSSERLAPPATVHRRSGATTTLTARFPVPPKTHPDKETKLQKYPRNLNLELLLMLSAMCSASAWIGTGRIHARGCHENAAIDDKQVLYVMATAPFVDHRTVRVLAHGGCPHQVPAALR